MPSNYNFTQDGLVYSFDDVFVPRDIFDTTAVGGPGNFTVSGQDIEDYFITEYDLIDQYVGDELWAWGRNNSVQLGNNTTTTRSIPFTTFAGGTNWKQVSCGGEHTAAIKTDGTLWTWGQNYSGQLGINLTGTTTYRSTPVTTFAGGTNWKQVSCGGARTSAIKTDGTLWTWGAGSVGSLGNNANTLRSTPITTFAGGNDWKQVSSGGSHTAAIKIDGTLWIWGNNAALGHNQSSNSFTPVTTFAGGINWEQVSSGNQHTAAVKTDGTLWTWGNGFSGPLGNTQTTNRSTPVTTFAGGTNWKQVFCALSHTAAIKTDGTLWNWGVGSYGKLGTNDATDRSTPVTTFAGGTNWKQVSAGNGHTTAIKTDGTLWVWGQNNYGQLGINLGSTNRSTPVTTFAGGTNWKQVSGGERYMATVFSGTTPDLPIS